MTFADWVEERSKLTEDEILDIDAEAQGLEVVEPVIPPVPKPYVLPPEVIIARIEYPKWWINLRTAAISLNDAGTQAVVSGRSDSNVFVAAIVLTVDGETNVSFSFGVFGSSGSIKLGGEGQPMGMVIAMGNSPASCGKSGFSVTSSGAGVSIGGFVSYYQIKE